MHSKILYRVIIWNDIGIYVNCWTCDFFTSEGDMSRFCFVNMDPPSVKLVFNGIKSFLQFIRSCDLIRACYEYGGIIGVSGNKCIFSSWNIRGVQRI